MYYWEEYNWLYLEYYIVQILEGVTILTRVSTDEEKGLVGRVY